MRPKLSHISKHCVTGSRNTPATPPPPPATTSLKQSDPLTLTRNSLQTDNDIAQPCRSNHSHSLTRKLFNLAGE
ncbi:hypothetical protein MJO28_006443 [Puccinia striiformis f. sp. tritici]|uniref:Uncharacterized protein n=1 Tax=Puccinia striiformis f. sp. tritici TaxID=168172 RepID=A0ACC0EH23_9BASI|nr:hypothetical protein Pst134EA_011613 [Puccinia striiformis f. sp. tritici]KAI9605208.1 hypothetical protein H4Q26_003186 [Puccinia striiformis f. sp. tritici PST-130]KAH9467991.1 hypothetical protein Pst134EA_011613 [Puccinia striiformis f. sp. tritici]KAI7953896.1 hypothetical protein MJO28_006443 [Puccinia striiformis f. sp. tritici]KAI7958202.1 hypothetical protein MJO29_006419 [Puccinia striiformis f. sp. tritici]KAI9609040.1 hypothetical protein KEM48_003124 [Puccinia striiformis f. sp